MKAINVKNLVLTAILAAIIIVMTIIPYTGYISYGSLFEITTLHIIVILGATLLGWKSGMLLGGVWGITCMIRALTNPLWLPFVNPLVSVVPRILVGLVAAVVFSTLSKKLFKVLIKSKKERSSSYYQALSTYIALIVAAITATLTNTVLVIYAYNIFGGMIKSYQAIYDTMKTILNLIITTNGLIELALAVILVPVLFKVLSKEMIKIKK